MKANTATNSQAQPTELKSLQIGSYKIFAIPTGQFGLDGGAMFGTVPKVLWEKTNPADEKNRILMEARAMLMVDEKNQKKILIDTGNGSDFVAKYGEKLGNQFATMYNVDPNGPSLLNSLKRLGIHPGQITDVILTHLHFDHAGGATTTNAAGELVPTFPNAQYHVQKENLETARNPNRREKASYFAANFEPLIKHNKLSLIEGSKQNLFPGIHVQVSNGHTRAHQNVIIEDDSQQLVYCGDVVPTSSHVRSAWVMGYDLDPLTLIEEKRSLLAKSQNKKTYFFFEHDPYCDFATVEFEKDDFKTKERFVLAQP